MADNHNLSQIHDNTSSLMNQDSPQHEEPTATALARDRAPHLTAAKVFQNSFSNAIGARNQNNRSSWNDVDLIRGRRANSNNRVRALLKLACEDKISRYKLEEVHCSLPSSVKSTFIMTFSPDGQRVASTHGDHRIYICDLNTGKLLDTLEGHPKTPWCLAWHPSNKEILASGCLAGEVRVWDLRSKACETWTSKNNTIITSLDFHPKERILVIATANVIHFWDWSRSSPFAKSMTIHEREKVKFVVFDSSGTKLITGISNPPRYVGYSSDSLQNRMIDGYISAGNQLQTDNMTQSSEIASSPVDGGLISSRNPNDNDVTRSSDIDGQLNLSTNTINMSNSNNNNNNNNSSNTNNNSSNNNNNNHSINISANNNADQDSYYRNTLTLSRVASLYRQLEALEDSMRNANFTPYMSPRPVGTETSTNQATTTTNESTSNQSNTNIEDAATNSTTTSTTMNTRSHSQSPPTTNMNPSQNRENSNEHVRPNLTPNTFEPYLVTFDENLEQLQLPPLVVDGQVVNLASIIERYPIDISHQLHYVMQYESINLVNQNFIRISKLMSSARLYRQVVQQIQSSESGQSHYQANQILTAQSVSPRSARSAAHLPIVLRNFFIGDLVDPNASIRMNNRPTDPVMAIQFRNSVRNVPLVTICKLDLISARAICIIRSQQIIEDSLTLLQEVRTNRRPQNRTTESDESGSAEQTIPSINEPLSCLLGQLHSSLSLINSAPLTTSNVYTHIVSLRVLIERLLKRLSSMLSSQADGRRLSDLIHNTAFSLTGRRWNIPMGASYDELRLDVIHTLCIVDLSLHFARQVQFLQMQRISSLARIEESIRLNGANLVQEANSSVTTNYVNTSQEFQPPPSDLAGPSTSITTESLPGSSKRKENDETTEPDAKRQKGSHVQLNQTPNAPGGGFSIDSGETNQRSTDNLGSNGAFLQQTQAQNSFSEASPNDRLVIWNNQPSNIEQSLQRLLVASSLGSSQFFVRIYHRLHGSSSLPLQAANIIDQALDYPNLPHETRRRALSQDHSSELPESSDLTMPSNVIGSGRSRARAPPAVQVNFVPSGSGASQGGGIPLETWQRQPHFHVYQTRGAGQHLWFNQWAIPLPVNYSNYRLQCWNFSIKEDQPIIPNIKDSQANIITHKCRIHNDSSVDVSSDGTIVACLVPREDIASCIPCFDLKIFSIKSQDFGTCYYRLPHGSNAMSVSLSPSGNFVVVGLASHKFLSSDLSEDDVTIAKVFNLGRNNSFGFVRDIKIKRDSSSLSLNAIRWMYRGIVYNVGPQHHQRYQAARMRNFVAS